jgi:penicillin-binding protein-related factor A (putative recombinase)
MVSYLESHPSKGISYFVLSFFSCSTFYFIQLDKVVGVWHVIKMRGISIALVIPFFNTMYLEEKVNK